MEVLDGQKLRSRGGNKGKMSGHTVLTSPQQPRLPLQDLNKIKPADSSAWMGAWGTPLAEELALVYGCWGREIQFYFRM